jgi:hypothetical protein
MGKEITLKGLKMKANSASKLQERITQVKRSMEQAKPRSQRKVELELQLRDLMTKLLRSEIRINKRAA